MSRGKLTDLRVWRLVALLLALPGLSLVVPALAQESRAGGGEYLLQGVVRPGLPAAIHDAEGRAWGGRWGTLRVDVKGNAAVLLWPRSGVPQLDGPGSPPPDGFRALLASEVVVGLLPEVVRRWQADAARAERERAALEQRLRRRARFVELEEALFDLAAPVLSALDLIVALDRTELERRGPVREWVGLGGCAVVLRGPVEGAAGLGRVLVAAGPAAEAASGLARVAAELVPGCPQPPRPRTGSVRLWAGLVSLSFLAALGWGAGGRRRRWVGWMPAAALGTVVVLAFPSSAWTLRSSCAIWGFPGEGGRAWVHSAHQVVPRGRGVADVEIESQGLLLTAVPSGASVVARQGRIRVTWRGPGRLAGIEARDLGGGFRVRRAAGRTLIAARLPAGIELVDAHFIRPGEMRVLGTLRAGSAVAVEEAARAERIPDYLRSLLRGLGRRPPMRGLIVGRLRGGGLTGRHFVCAVPAEQAP